MSNFAGCKETIQTVKMKESKARGHLAILGAATMLIVGNGAQTSGVNPALGDVIVLIFTGVWLVTISKAKKSDEN